MPPKENELEEGFLRLIDCNMLFYYIPFKGDRKKCRHCFEKKKIKLRPFSVDSIIMLYVIRDTSIVDQAHCHIRIKILSENCFIISSTIQNVHLVSVQIGSLRREKR